MARALAHKPQVLLLDEPFGALDAKIREELRRTIRQVQRELGITTVLVTHDQEEAFALADRIGVMNLGRLLEVGSPHDLYARPATRFVATFLGAANLLLARQSADGIRFGATPVSARRRGARCTAGREHEVVAVVRPEEVEVAATREQLTSNYIARGAVEEIVFTGALERLRVRLIDEPSAAQLLGRRRRRRSAPREVTRTQHEQRSFQVRPGQQVAIGARRLHVLPTPLSSFLACAPTEAEAAELGARAAAREPVHAHEDPRRDCAPSRSWAAEAACQSAGAVRRRRRASPPAPTARSDGRMAAAARRARSAGAAATMRARRSACSSTGPTRRCAAPRSRCPPACCATCPPKPCTSASCPKARRRPARRRRMRALLDARSEAQAAHGLEMRTELRHRRDASTELARNSSAAAAQMLVLGVTDIDDMAGSAIAACSAAQPAGRC